MPLASLSFFAATLITLAVFYTFSKLNQRYSLMRGRYYGLAYLLLSGLFVLLGLGTLLGEGEFLRYSVILASMMFLLASFYCIRAMVSGQRPEKTVLVATALLLVVYFILRLWLFPVAPYMQEGILILNAELPISMVLGLLMLLVWFPAGYLVASEITVKTKVPQLLYVLASVYLMSSLAGLIFVSTKSLLTLAISFGLLLLSFALVVYTNVLVLKMGE